MNIAVFVPDFYPSATGFAQSFVNLYESLVERNIIKEIHVFAPFETSYSYPNIFCHVYKKPKGIDRMHRLSRRLGRWYDVRMTRDIQRKIKDLVMEAKIDFIFLESMYLGWLSPVLNNAVSVPLIYRFHGTGPEYTRYLPHAKDVRERKAYIDYIFENEYIGVTTHFYIEFFHQYFKDYSRFFNKKFFIIPNTSERIGRHAASVIPGTKGSIRFLQLGRMNLYGYHQKGFTDTLEAFYYLEELYPPEILERVEYVTIGAGEMKMDFLKKVAKLSHIKHIHYETLSNSQVKEELIKAHVVVIPSRNEGMSMFVTEAMSAGKAFIFTDNNGMRDMLFHGYNGRRMNEYNYLGLADGIRFYLDFPDKIEEYGRNSLEKFDLEFSKEAVCKKFTVLIKMVEDS